ncbi:hypothetical protein PI125_g7114 [Phytophthora idaei]|nr:hypothetical protein PI125_g7114 [Phytophthora idaei]
MSCKSSFQAAETEFSAFRGRAVSRRRNSRRSTQTRAATSAGTQSSFLRPSEQIFKTTPVALSSMSSRPRTPASATAVGSNAGPVSADTTVDLAGEALPAAPTLTPTPSGATGGPATAFAH